VSKLYKDLFRDMELRRVSILIETAIKGACLSCVVPHANRQPVYDDSPSQTQVTAMCLSNARGQSSATCVNET
jgi:hypothetical protein